MIFKTNRIFILLLLFSCGIQTYENIEGATVVSSSLSSIEFTVDIDKSPNITKFVIYSRYYIDINNNKEFKDITKSDILTNSDEYLKKLGYTSVSFTEEDKTYVDIENTKNINISYTSELVTLSFDNTTFNLINNYTNNANTKFTHIIGKYTDEDGKNFKNEFLKNSSNSNVTSFYIEFAIINKGISSSIEQLESLPVYLGTLQVQI